VLIVGGILNEVLTKGFNARIEVFSGFPDLMAWIFEEHPGFYR